MDLAVAVFVKTPGLSELKSRLAAGSSPAFAREWYLRSLRAVCSVVEQANLPLYLAISEHHAMLPDSRAWADFPRQVWQGAAPDLGAKMHAVMQQLLERHSAVLLLGADLPHLQSSDLIDARDALARGVDYVLGHAHDGGFWTFASTHLPSLAEFRSVAYSQASTAQQFVAALAPGHWQSLRQLSDVDFVDDLTACAQALKALTTPSVEQCQLREWMDQTLNNGLAGT